MAVTEQRLVCIKCKTIEAVAKCNGCCTIYCMDHIKEHQNELNEQLNRTEDEIRKIKVQIEKQMVEPHHHDLMKTIDKWEWNSIEKIQQVANEVRHDLSLCIVRFSSDLNFKLKQLTDEVIQYREDIRSVEPYIQTFNEELQKLKYVFNNPIDFKLQHEFTPFINKIRLIKRRSSSLIPTLTPSTQWLEKGTFPVGGNRRGNAMNQLYCPWGLCITDDQMIYVADCANHRIMEWSCGSRCGRIVAGGHGPGNHSNQLKGPTDVVIDKERKNMIISDNGNKRIVQWSLQNSSYEETIVSNVYCYGLAMDDDGFFYIADYDRHEVRRYRIGEKQGTLVAGGNGPGDRLDQLHFPRYVFVDHEGSLYVSEKSNHRVMKWTKNAKQGVLVAGGHGQGSALTQLSDPHGIFVDHLNIVYIADCLNHRIVRWLPGSTQGEIVIGGNDPANRLSYPIAVNFDSENNIYVSENGNDRISKFTIDFMLMSFE